MPKKYVCPFTKEELEKLYITDGRTLEELCEVMGIKSPITARKVLHSFGISTNNNQRLADKSKHGMNDEEFKAFLEREYSNGASMGEIGLKLGITPSGVRKYFVKYNIGRRGNTEFLESSPNKNPNWRGGRRMTSEGYIEVYCPDHPNANRRKCVYEHQLVVEQYIGRYIKPGEVVHHLDGNKSNNDISNLLLLTNSDHIKLHAILKRSDKLMGRNRK